jgi:hypothetical protein
MVDREQIVQNHLDVILGKMFEMVNLDYKTVWPEYKDDPQWYWRNEWSAETEEEFVKWLTQYFMGNAGARKYLMRFPSKSRRNCEGAARWFDMQYGWKTIMEKKDEDDR